MSPEVFLSDIFDVARQNMCCDIFAVNSLSPCLNAKTKIQHKLFCVPHQLYWRLAFVSVTSTAVCLFAFCIRRQTKTKVKQHALLNDVHQNAVSVTSTAVLRFSASHQLPSVCFVCFGSVEIKHMHKKTQIKLFHAGLKNNMQNVQTFPNLQLQI